MLAGCGSSSQPALLATPTPPKSQSEIATTEALEAAEASTITPAPKPGAAAASTKPAATVETKSAVGQANTDVKAAIVAALAAMDGNGPYRIKVTSTLPDAPPAEVFVAPPDRARYTATLPDGTHVEVVSIGAKTYVLDPDGVWQASESSDSGADSIKPNFSSPEFFSAISAEVVKSPETVDGVATRVYAFTQTEDSVTTQVTLWVRTDNGLLLKLQLVDSDETVTYAVAYDPSVTVQAPAP